MMKAEIGAILAEQGQPLVEPAAVAIEADLYDLGPPSHSKAGVTLSLKDFSAVECPDEMLQEDSLERRDLDQTALTLRRSAIFPKP
jgi:hypothetical protein